VPITPVEIRHVQMRRGLLGFKRKQVERLLEQIAGDFEQVWRERADLQDKLEEMQEEIARHVELETLLRSTLVSAERAAQERTERAHHEAGVIVNEAHAEARTILRDAISEKEELQRDVRRIQALLRAALAAVDEAPGPEEPAEEKPEEPTPSADVPAAPAGWSTHVPKADPDGDEDAGTGMQLAG
jgi:cell division initiation protein